MTAAHFCLVGSKMNHFSRIIIPFLRCVINSFNLLHVVNYLYSHHHHHFNKT